MADTITIATIGSRTFKTEKGAHNEAMRSLSYAHDADCTIGITEHDGGHVVVYFSEMPAADTAKALAFTPTFAVFA